MADSPLTPWKDRPWVLVSSSPTRLKVLREQGIDATVVHPLTEEMTLPYHAIEQSLVELAKAKLLNADITDEQIGLACDTLVLCGDTVLGKPGNVEEARHMLQIQHEVGRQEILTGVALR